MTVQLLSGTSLISFLKLYSICLLSHVPIAHKSSSEKSIVANIQDKQRLSVACC
jgi:hypothetical protein